MKPRAPRPLSKADDTQVARNAIETSRAKGTHVKPKIPRESWKNIGSNSKLRAPRGLPEAGDAKVAKNASETMDAKIASETNGAKSKPRAPRPLPEAGETKVERNASEFEGNKNAGEGMYAKRASETIFERQDHFRKQAARRSRRMPVHPRVPRMRVKLRISREQAKQLAPN